MTRPFVTFKFLPLLTETQAQGGKINHIVNVSQLPAGVYQAQF